MKNFPEFNKTPTQRGVVFGESNGGGMKLIFFYAHFKIAQNAFYEVTTDILFRVVFFFNKHYMSSSEDYSALFFVPGWADKKLLFLL